MTPFDGLYFLDAKTLAHELRQGAFSEERALKQVIAHAIISGGATSGIIQAGTSMLGAGSAGIPPWNSAVLGLRVLAFVASAVIAYFGMWLTYQVNKKGDGKDYFMRFAALSLPIALKLLVQFVPVVVLLFGVSIFLATTWPAAFGFVVAYFPLAALCGFYILAIMFYLRMRAYLAIASGLDQLTGDENR